MKTAAIIKTNGFTLVETLIYTALIGVTLSGFISFGLNISALKNKNRAMEEVQSGASLAMDIISAGIREAKRVEVPAKGASTDWLRLEMPDGSFLTFATSSDTGVLTMTEGVGDGTAMAGSQIAFPELTFTNLGESGARDSVRIEMTAAYRNDDGGPDGDYSISLETAVGAREKL